MLNAFETTPVAFKSLLRFLAGEGWLFARPTRSARARRRTAPARTEWMAPGMHPSFSRALSFNRAVVPKASQPGAEALEASAFLARLIELDGLRGKEADAIARRREALEWLGDRLFSRMRMHRELFRPQWLAAGDGEHYDARFKPLDPGRDRLFTCRVEGDELVAVVERRLPIASSRPLMRTVRFPLRFLADEGESRMWSEASQRLRRLRVEREEANARFDEAETQVQALLERYSAAVA